MPRTGMPYLSPRFTSSARPVRVCLSNSVPTKTESPTPATLSLMASSKSVVTLSSSRWGPTMLVPPETLSTTLAPDSGSTEVRSTPLVSMMVSA